MSGERAPGVLGGGYAHDRRVRPHLAFRAASRARVAVEAFIERSGKPSHDQAVHVLELGAAEGLTLAEIRRLLGVAGDNLGVEASEELVALSVAGVDLVHGDVLDLPAAVPAGRFHLCTALAVLEHLSAPELALRGALSRLRPGGVFVASCPEPAWDAIASRLGLLDDDSHQQRLDLDGLVKLLQSEGFVRVETRRFMFAPVAFLPYLGVRVDPGRALALDARLRRFEALGFAFVNQAVIAEKPPAGDQSFTAGG